MRVLHSYSQSDEELQALGWFAGALLLVSSLCLSEQDYYAHNVLVLEADYGWWAFCVVDSAHLSNSLNRAFLSK